MTSAKLKASGLEPRLTVRRWSPERLLVRSPDLSSARWMALLALGVVAIMAVWLGTGAWNAMDSGYGDTDDATRLVAVRALLDGRGWWDQLVTRYQPPLGLYMHWSRLLDGGLAGLDRLFRLGLSADDAEFAARFTWPLLWIFPAALASLMTARRLGLGLLNNAAVIVCAVILASDIWLYIQFRPGRIDHHDVQMTCAFLALAGVVQPGRNIKGALLAGIASGLGMAVGLESLAFSAVIGAMLALRFGFDREHAGAAQAYGLSLALTASIAFAIQTPPWRWGVEACDMLSWNLVAAVLVSGFGLAALARFGAALRWPARLGLLAGLGAAAGATYLGLYPRCIHGFFADVDPRVRPIWLNYVQEVRPINFVLKRNTSEGVARIAVWTLGAIAWLILGLRPERRRDFAWWLSGLMMAMGIAAAASAIRMTGYAEWFAAPIVAAAVVDVLVKAEYANWFAVLLAAAVASPSTVAAAADGATGRILPLLPSKHAHAAHGPARKKPPAPVDTCFDDDSFDPLADAKPVGIVLSEVDAGPFVLANTDDSALAAPYHRMAWGVLRAHAILKAPATGGGAAGSEALARQAGIAYVLECRMHQHHGDRDDMARTALQKQLDAGVSPPWLQPLTARSASLQIYRVLAPGVAAAPPPAKPKDG